MRKFQIPLMLTVYNQGKSDTAMLTVYNQGKDLHWQFDISLAKDYGQKFVQPLKTMSRDAIFLFYMVYVSKGR